MCQTAETLRRLHQLLVAHHLMLQQQLGLLEYLYCTKQPKRTIVIISCKGVFPVNSENMFAFSDSQLNIMVLRKAMRKISMADSNLVSDIYYKDSRKQLVKGYF